MRGLQIVCSPNRSTQEWPPTWCTKGSSITPFPGYGVPSACMRAARAGLILTPHLINELGGPTSVGRQEARPPCWSRYPQALRCRSTRGRCCRAARRWTKAWQKNSGSDKIPYFLSLPRSRTDSINLFLSETLFVFLWVIKCDMYSFKAFSNGDKRWKNGCAVDWLLAKLSTGLSLLLKNQHRSQ